MKYIYLILFLATQLLSGQEILADFDLELKGLISKRNVFSIVEDENIALFFDNKKEMKCYLLNDNKSISSEFIFERPQKKFKEILGYRVEGDDYYIYFTNKKKNSFAVLDINFKTKKSSVEEIDLKLKSKFLDAFSKNGSFYLLCLAENSVIDLYRFNKKSSFKKLVYSLRDKSLRLSENLIVSARYSLATGLEKIDENTPNSIENTSNYNKIYTTENEIIITLDNSDFATKLISLNTTNNTSKVKRIKHIDVRKEKERRMSSNSFYHQGKLFQLSTTKHNLAFSFYNIETNERSKVINLNVNDSIWFKNSSIIQKKSNGFDQQRELGKTKQFLRKVSAAKAGISIITIKGLDQITIGGVAEIASGGGFMMNGAGVSVSGGAIGGFGSVYMTPTFYSYGTYSNTKSTFINCLFDGSLNHKNGEFLDNAFDKIKTYEDSVADQLKLKTVFKYKNNYIFGYYWNKKYKLRVFNH